MTHISFWVAGEPKGQPRPKAFSRAGHASVYDPGTAEGWKAIVRVEADKNKPPVVLTGPVALRLNFFIKRPKSHYNSKGLLKPGAAYRHIGKPDADNLAKAVMDAITGLGTWWKDDSQVAVLHVVKSYVEGPRNPERTTQGCCIELREVAP